MKAHILDTPSTFTYLGRNDDFLQTAFNYHISKRSTTESSIIYLLGSGPLEAYTFLSQLRRKRFISQPIEEIKAIENNPDIQNLITRLKEGKKVSFREIATVCKNPDRPNTDLEGDRLEASLKGVDSFHGLIIDREGIQINKELANNVEVIDADIFDYLQNSSINFESMFVANFVLQNMVRSGYDINELHKALHYRMGNKGTLCVNTTVLDAQGITEDLSMKPEEAYLIKLKEWGFDPNVVLLSQLTITSKGKLLGSTGIIADSNDLSTPSVRPNRFSDKPWYSVIEELADELSNKRLPIDISHNMNPSDYIHKGDIIIAYLNHPIERLPSRKQIGISAKLEDLIKVTQERKSFNLPTTKRLAKHFYSATDHN